MSVTHVETEGWEALAAERLNRAWLGRLRLRRGQTPLLIDQEGYPLHFVTEEADLAPYALLVCESVLARITQLPHDLYAWRVGQELWLGDDLTLHLPVDAPWESLLDWRAPNAGEEVEVGRLLALLSDWLMARTPEGSVSSLMGELLARDESAEGPLPDRPDLDRSARLLRWRASRLLTELMGALAEGRVAEVEGVGAHLAGLGGTDLPLGDQYVMGLVAGARLWPRFLLEGSGLHVEPVLQRMVRAMRFRTTPLSSMLLATTLEAGRWGWRWHALHAALHRLDGFPDERRDALFGLAGEWVAARPERASAALAGFVAPFLWHQRHLV